MREGRDSRGMHAAWIPYTVHTCFQPPLRAPAMGPCSSPPPTTTHTHPLTCMSTPSSTRPLVWMSTSSGCASSAAMMSPSASW
jgi:hypothetical protein